MTSYSLMPSPLGELVLTASDGALTGIRFTPPPQAEAGYPQWQHNDAAPVLQQARRELNEYFDRRRRHFEVRLTATGTAFQQSVWTALMTIEFGRWATYGELAAAVGRPRAARAVGAAVGANPIAIIIPCHRIVGRGGSLTGYAGGLDRKTWLLSLEGFKPAARPPAR